MSERRRLFLPIAGLLLVLLVVGLVVQIAVIW